MTWQEIVSRVLLVLGVGVELLCCVGVVTMRTTFARLHYVGPATVLGPVLIAGAILTTEALTMSGLKAMLIALTMGSVGPIVTHATGRAARLRRFGSLEAQPGDRKEMR